MSQGIMVVAEQNDGVFRKVAFEVMSEGKRIADALDCPLIAVVLGADIEACAQTLQAYGPDRILAVEDSQLAEYLTDVYTQALSAVIQQEDPGILLFGASVQGKDLSARIAARFEAPLATDCVAITCEGGGLTATRPIYGGKLLAEVVLTGERQLFSMRPNTTAILKPGGAAVVEKVSAEIGNKNHDFHRKKNGIR